LQNSGSIYFAALKNVRMWQMNDNALMLKNGDGLILVKLQGRGRVQSP
jgi:hypothetical protein